MELTTLIVGNGLDLNLGLATDYTSFIESEEFNSLDQSAGTLANYLAHQHNLNNWVDVENELKSYVSVLMTLIGQSDPDGIRKLKTDFERQYLELCETLKKYLQRIEKEPIDTNSFAFSFINTLPNYLGGTRRIQIYDFNYTNSLQVLLQQVDGIRPSQVDYNQIHGNLGSSIIFGVEEHANLPSEFIYLLKATHPQYHSTNLNETLVKSNNLIIFGHSLGNTDHNYFSYFFKTACDSPTNPARNIKISCHGRDGYYDIQRQLRSLTGNQISNFRLVNNVEFINTSDLDKF